MKLQTPVGFAPLNGKLDLRATEVEVEPGGSIKDHYHFHFGPGIRRMVSGELNLIYADTKKEQVVGTGEYFYEPGDVNINGVNRGKAFLRAGKSSASPAASASLPKSNPSGARGPAFLSIGNRTGSDSTPS
jgi:hypothetical protein